MTATTYDAEPQREEVPQPDLPLATSRLALPLTLLPFLVAAIVLALGASDLRPVHDIAHLEMRVRDIGSHEVLLGPYSRDGWHHPGPAIYYLMVVPYRLAGSTSAGLYLGALAVNAGSVAAMAFIARRRGGEALMLLTLLASGVLMLSLGPDFIRDPWNPSITVLPFGLMLFLTWTMSCGDRWALPAGVALASILAQTHIGYVALAVPLLGWGAIGLVATSIRKPARDEPTNTGQDIPPQETVPRDAERQRFLGAALATAAVAIVLWAPPVFEQLTGDYGNLGAALHYFRTADEPGHTLTDGWRIINTQFTLPPEWVTGTETTRLSQEPLALYTDPRPPWLLLPLALAVGLLWRRGGSDARRLLITVAVGFALGHLAIARTTGVAFSYRLQWVQVLGMIAGLLMAWGAWLAIRPYLSTRHLPRATAGALAGVVLLATANALGAARAGTPDGDMASVVAAVTPDALASAAPAEGEVVLVRPTSFGAALYTTGLALSLERSGVEVRLPGHSEASGGHRALADEEPAVTLVVAVDDDIHTALDDPDMELVAIDGTPAPPREPDNPVVQSERAFSSGDTEAMKALGREYLDDAGAEIFTPAAVAVFRER